MPDEGRVFLKAFIKNKHFSPSLSHQSNKQHRHFLQIHRNESIPSPHTRSTEMSHISIFLVRVQINKIVTVMMISIPSEFLPRPQFQFIRILPIIYIIYNIYLPFLGIFHSQKIIWLLHANSILPTLPCSCNGRKWFFLDTHKGSSTLKTFPQTERMLNL